MNKIAPAFVAAKKAFGPALKDKSNPAFRSKYADLGACIDAVEDALLANGIAAYHESSLDDAGITADPVSAKSQTTSPGGPLSNVALSLTVIALTAAKRRGLSQQLVNERQAQAAADGRIVNARLAALARPPQVWSTPVPCNSVYSAVRRQTATIPAQSRARDFPARAPRTGLTSSISEINYTVYFIYSVVREACQEQRLTSAYSY